MTSHDSSTVTHQLPITEEHPIHSGTTDPQHFLPSTVVPWTSRAPEHQVALARAMSIKDRLAEHGTGFYDDDVKKVFVKRSASEVVDHLASMLEKLCSQACDQRKMIFRKAIEIEMALGDLVDFTSLVHADSMTAMVDSIASACALRADPGASDRVVEIFGDTARMTICEPSVLVKMVRAQSFGAMCCAVPLGLRQAIGLDVVCSANKHTKPIAPRPIASAIALNPWRESARRIANSIGNLDAFGGVEIVVG